ncbi:C40 family peptidase [Sphaerisporangium corydalis]|uniref:C40 family peptidase n=1 Tax=Sphaerisporangium corydalis TaxID=1441875 RepID=A0ABV9ES37_9ACTN|nr:C40 family peptidase [Sphaerisporangium corydalis]
MPQEARRRTAVVMIVLACALTGAPAVWAQTGPRPFGGNHWTPAPPAGQRPAGTAGTGTRLGDLAADWALTQLGKPYTWAAAGPRAYDCSGLTMRAWQRAGVGLSHWTGTQWTSGPKISLDAVRRGDLLFFGHRGRDPAAIRHVGIYIGGGLMVHAPRTGDVVRVASIWRPHLVGVVRPRDRAAV